MNKRYWLRGGVLVCALALIWFAILLLGLKTVFPDQYLLYFFPAMFSVAMGIGMCGDNCPSEVETWVYISVAGIISLLLYFVAGALLGYIYGKVKEPRSQSLRG